MSIVSDFAAINSRLQELSKRPGDAEPRCDACENGGWEMYSTGHMDPHFRQCGKCFNPKGHRSP
jgi:hypothetical protein